MYPMNKGLFLVRVTRGRLLNFMFKNNVFHSKMRKFLSYSALNRTKEKHLSLLFTPVPVKPPTEETEVGAELVGKLDKLVIVKVLNQFYRNNNLRTLAEENGIDGRFLFLPNATSEFLLVKGLSSFRKFCVEATTLPTDLHVVIADIEHGAGNPIDIFPFFLRHVKEIFPHLECLEDLKKIGDLRSPANWYQNTRSQRRKIIFHCGPTNSGKTYHAIQSFVNSKSGVYCGPLKLLAVEIFNKANELGTPCDLVTGEEIIQVRPDGDFADHVSCTIEMCSVEKEYDVAVIDEVQMIKDLQRGWAWTRALLGLRAREIHICGEEAAIHLVDSILCTTNEELEVKKYSRLTKLSIVDSVQTVENIQPGDCIVCFNKSDIYYVTKALEQINVKTAVIYGTLPPGTKLSQCKKFNDPDDPCKVLVATDAVGMGLNLSIKRVVFYSIEKTSMNEKGEVELCTLSVSQALQVAGRAGRYGSNYSEGYVTTFKAKDLPMLKSLLVAQPEPVLSAGIIPTIDQIELYSYYLPNSTLSSLIEIFVKLSTIDDSLYFICDLKDIKYLAAMIEHVPLPLRVKYTFCCAPINRKLQFACSMFLKFAKLYSENNAITFNWLCKHISWPLKAPKSIRDLMQLEAVHDVLDLYLWLSYRFPENFPDGESVKIIQSDLDVIIHEGVAHLTNLLNIGMTPENPKIGIANYSKKPILDIFKKELKDVSSNTTRIS